MGVPQLADLVLETANAPGTGAFTLGGAPDGRQTFADAFPNGGDVYYYASDGVQSEWGVGTLTVGSPNVLVRKTIIGNLFGTTSALNFTSGVTVYCEVPAKKTPSLDDDGQLPVSGSPDFTRDVAVSAKAADARYLRVNSSDGQTVSGLVTFTGNLSKDAPAGANAQIQVTSGRSARWAFGRDSAAETGKSTGSNFVIARFDNSGNYIDSPFGINRETGVVSANVGMEVPDVSDFDGKGALNAGTAEDRYAKLVDDIPVGCPQAWPLDTPPSGWLILNGASFDVAQYPKLALAFPSGVLPDMRGKFIRGWDNGAGIDPNDGQTNPGNARALLSSQSDALQNITGTFSNKYRGYVGDTTGAFSNPASQGWVEFSDWGGVGGAKKYDGAAFDASLVARTSTETRPTNMAWNMIVRAA